MAEKHKSVKNPFKNDTLEYDERSGRFQEMGVNYGVGKNQPVGHEQVSFKSGVPASYVVNGDSPATPSRIQVE